MMTNSKFINSSVALTSHSLCHPRLERGSHHQDCNKRVTYEIPAQGGDDMQTNHIINSHHSLISNYSSKAIQYYYEKN